MEDKSLPKKCKDNQTAQIELDYKNGTISTTIEDLDKEGSAYQGKNVHFVGQLDRFVKDDNGNTVGANLSTPGSYSLSYVQIAFPPNTDLTQLNENDTLEVWGIDSGVYSGANAFGATVQEVGINVMYMTDQTTNYEAHT